MSFHIFQMWVFPPSIQMGHISTINTDGYCLFTINTDEVCLSTNFRCGSFHHRYRWDIFPPLIQMRFVRPHISDVGLSTIDTDTGHISTINTDEYCLFIINTDGDWPSTINTDGRYLLPLTMTYIVFPHISDVGCLSTIITHGVCLTGINTDRICQTVAALTAWLSFSASGQLAVTSCSVCIELAQSVMG